MAYPPLPMANSRCSGDPGIVLGMETTPFHPHDRPRHSCRTYVVVQHAIAAPDQLRDSVRGTSAEWSTLGTVCAPSRREAARLATVRFGSTGHWTLHVAAASSVPVSLLIAALAADGQQMIRDERRRR